MKVVSFSLEGGNKYFGNIEGHRFYIGSRVSYEGNKGLMNVAGSADQKYDCSGYKQYGMWADFIYPTAMAEGALFHTLNTYDSAHFTFSFLQYAAHVPNGDFVRFLRALLELDQAPLYFPDLVLKNKRICRLTDNGAIPIESDTSTAGLLDYLNPSASEVEDTEIIQGARFVHWAQNDPEHRRVQVQMGIQHFKEKMVSYATQYGLDGASDLVCAVVADIRHQGRARSPVIALALKSPAPLEALLEIGVTRYAERIKTLRHELEALKAAGALGKYKYSVSKKDFVPL
jgi:hypothetical protein